MIVVVYHTWNGNVLGVLVTPHCAHMMPVDLRCARSTPGSDHTVVGIVHRADQGDHVVIHPPVGHVRVVLIGEIVQRVEAAVVHAPNLRSWPTALTFGRTNCMHTRSETVLQCPDVSEVVVHAHTIIQFAALW